MKTPWTVNGPDDGDDQNTLQHKERMAEKSEQEKMVMKRMRQVAGMRTQDPNGLK